MQPITAQATAPGRPARPRGRWIWPLSGTAVVLAGTALIVTAATRAGAFGDGGLQQSALPARTVVVNGPVTSLHIDSYGAPVQVSRGPVTQVTVTETISDKELAGPGDVTARTDGGNLTLAAPSCQGGGCSVGFAVIVPASFPDVTVTASSDGGPVNVSGVAAVDIDSGSGPVRASDVRGLLTVTSEGGDIIASGAGSASLDSGSGIVTASQIPGTLNITSAGGRIDVHDVGSATLYSGSGDVAARSVDGPLTATTSGGELEVNGLTGPLSADTGSGLVNASGVVSATARVNTEGGSAWLSFTKAPQSVQVTTGSGDATLVLPGGPYAVRADSAGGPELVSVPVSATAASTVAVRTGGGELQVKPAAGGR